MKNKSSTHSTILIIVLGLLVLSYIFKTDTLVLIATLVGVLSLLVPIFGKGLEWGWFKLAEVLGWINTRLLLGIVFFVFLFPLALLSRLSKRNTLKLKRSSGSVFTDRNHQYKKEDLENMW